MKTILRIILGIAATLGLLTVSTVPASAYPQDPWHIYNYNLYSSYVWIYKSTNCTYTDATRVDTLGSGETARYTEWQSFKVFGGSRWGVDVYNGTTRKWITYREYAGGTCVKAYPENAYRVRKPL